MRIGRILAPVHSLGPGERVCLWTKGCSKNCPGCISPELQNASGPEADEVMLGNMLGQIAKGNNCNGLTISGGDPFEQPEALLKLLFSVREKGYFEDILVYTGFTSEEIREGAAGEAGKKCLELIDVLIDGRYVKELNTPDCVLRGSSNQKVIFLNEDENIKKSYEEYMKQGRILQSFVHGKDTIITGIINGGVRNG